MKPLLIVCHHSPCAFFVVLLQSSVLLYKTFSGITCLARQRHIIMHADYGERLVVVTAPSRQQLGSGLHRATSSTFLRDGASISFGPRFTVVITGV